MSSTKNLLKFCIFACSFVFLCFNLKCNYFEIVLNIQIYFINQKDMYYNNIGLVTKNNSYQSKIILKMYFFFLKMSIIKKTLYELVI